MNDTKELDAAIDKLRATRAELPPVHCTILHHRLYDTPRPHVERQVGILVGEIVLPPVVLEEVLGPRWHLLDLDTRRRNELVCWAYGAGPAVPHETRQGEDVQVVA